MKRILSAALILFLLAPAFFARSEDNPGIDSLLRRLPTMGEDTNKVKLLNEIAFKYRRNNSEKAILYAKRSLALSEKLRNEDAITQALYILGNFYADHSDFSNALQCLNRALEMKKGSNDKEAVAALLNNIAVVYQSISNYPKAIEINLQALKLFDEIGNQYGSANCHINVGNVISKTGDFKTARNHYQKALDIYKKLKVPQGVAVAMNNIGDAYAQAKDYDHALGIFLEALKIYETESDAGGMCMALNNVACCYVDMQRYDMALTYAFRALEISRTNNLPEDLGYDYKTISDAYFGMATSENKDVGTGRVSISKQEALRKAELYIDSASAIFASIEMLTEHSEALELSARIRAKSGNYKEAYEKHVLYKTLYDSVFNHETDKKIARSALQYEFDKKEAAARAEQEKKDIRQRNILNSVIAGLLGVLIFSVVVYRQRNRINREKKRSEELLLNILPAEVADELKEKGETDARLLNDVTVLFTDFKGFTALSEKLTPKELVQDLHECFTEFDRIIDKYGLEKIKTIGDAYMAAGGLPTPSATHAFDIVSAALEINQFIESRKQSKIDRGLPFFEVRIGVHTGPVVAGIVGVKKFSYDIWGDTVNTASRMESSGSPGKVNISGTTYELVKERFTCVHRGKVAAKGKGDLDMYFVEGRS